MTTDKASIVVPPYVPPGKPRIAFVGEAPGAEEERNGRPFIGASGRLLAEMCEDAGFRKDDCYITNVVKTRPPGNDIEKASPSAYDPHWISQLRDELMAVKPNVVVPLGNVALRALCAMSPQLEWVESQKKYTIMNYRGSILESTLVPGLKVVPTAHPAYVLRQWHMKSFVTADLCRINEQSGFPDIRRRSRNFIMQPTEERVREIIDMIIEKNLPFSADIELFGKDLACLGIAWSAEECLCIPITINEGSYWGIWDEIKVWKHINRLMASKCVRVGQNFLFDLFWLRLYGLDCAMPVRSKVNVFDTMLMFHTLYAELPKGLAELCSLYTDQPYYKDEGKAWIKLIPNEQLWHYNCLDGMVTFEVYEALLRELEEAKMMDFYHRIPKMLLEPLLETMLRGVRVDMTKRSKAREEVGKQIIAKQAELDDLVGRHLNVDSPKQLSSYLYVGLGLKPKYNRKTGNVTSNELALLELNEKYNLPQIDLMLDIRDLSKLHSTFLGGGKKTKDTEGQVDVDGRMRCFYNPGGTDSGRLSSSKSPLRTGMNLQNIPRTGMAREIFIPDEGCAWVECDLSQADARVVAYVSGEKNLIAAFESGEDIHCYNGSILFDKKITKKEHPEERYIAKKLVHAANYGIRGQTFADSVNKEAKGLKLNVFFTKVSANEKLDLYYKKFDRIPQWHKEVQQELGRTRTISNLLGRRHVFFDHWGDDMFRKAYSFSPQSTVADCTNIAMIRMFERYPQYQIMLQVHDSLIVQCKRGEEERVMEALRECFDIELRVRDYVFKIPTDFKVTHESWGAFKEVK